LQGAFTLYGQSAWELLVLLVAGSDVEILLLRNAHFEVPEVSRFQKDACFQEPSSVLIL